MKNFLIAGALVATLNLIPSAAHATCIKDGTVAQLFASGTSTTIFLRSPNPTSTTIFIASMSNATFAAISTQALATQIRVRITASATTCPTSGSIGVIRSIILNP